MGRSDRTARLGVASKRGSRRQMAAGHPGGIPRAIVTSSAGAGARSAGCLLSRFGDINFSRAGRFNSKPY